VLFYAVSLPFFYLLVRKTSNARGALVAVGIYTLTPLSIFASRSFMPDMASLSFSLAALYLFARWLERAPDATLFIAMSLATSLAMLIKPPAVLIAVPLLVMAWDKYGARGIFRWELAALPALSLIVPVAAALAGRAYDCGFRRLAQLAGATPACFGAGVLVGVLASISYFCIAPHYEPKRLALWQAGLALNRITPSDALVLIADNGDPTGLYYSKRHGWHFLQDFGRSPVDSQHAIRELERLRMEGASYLVFTSNTFWGLEIYQAFREHVEARSRRVSETKAYLVFDIKGVKGNEVNVNWELRRAPHLPSPAPRWRHDEGLMQHHDRL
jgi:hypothetical protein